MAGNVAKAIYNTTLNYDIVAKLAKDAKLDEKGAEAVVAAVRWILESAAGAGVTSHVLDSELQQLGLPKEHASAITKVYTDHQEALQQYLKSVSLKVKNDTKWSCKIMGVDIGDDTLSPVVKLDLQDVKGSTEGEQDQQTESKSTTSIALTPHQLHSLIHELTEARQLMEGLY